MDIWMRWSPAPALCDHCHKTIVSKTPQVIGKLWRRHGVKVWTRYFYWHPKCWFEKNMWYLESHPYKSKGLRGRKRLQLEPEVKKQRLKLLRDRAVMVCRMKEAIERGNFKRVEILGQRIEGMKVEMEKLGGLPRSWEEGYKGKKDVIEAIDPESNIKEKYREVKEAQVGNV